MVVDGYLHGVTSLLLAGVLRRSKPQINVVLLSHDRDNASLVAAAAADVKDVLPRDADASMLCGSIARVMRGEKPVLYRIAECSAHHSEIWRLYAPRLARSGQRADRPDVTAGEIMALDCLVRGFTIAETARYLNLAPGTVKNRLQRLRVRHGLHSQTQLLHFANQRGWIEPGSAIRVVGA
jgi:DNA-binding NarL/FixJ family response regulator